MFDLFEKIFGTKKKTVKPDNKKAGKQSQAYYDDSERRLSSSPNSSAAATSRRRVQVQDPHQSSNVYVGLDFGTAFTKVAYEIAPSNEHKKYSVRFFSDGTLDDYMFPSVLYYDPVNGRIKIHRTAQATHVLEYFKLLMVNDALPKDVLLNANEHSTDNGKEQLCSAFYLAYVFSLTKDAVMRNPVSKNVTEQSKWYVNMGIPIESDTEEEQIRIFKTVLNVAWAYSTVHPHSESVDLNSMDEFFSKYKDVALDSLNVYPELFAEVLLYQQDPNIPDGFYTVVDIGGGTADIATFYKYKPYRQSSKVECLQKRVVWLGLDSLAGKIDSSGTGLPSKVIKDFLNNSNVNFNDRDLSCLSYTDFISIPKLLECRKGFRTAYGTCVMSSRDLRQDQMYLDYEHGQNMKYFALGGAGHVSFYDQSVGFMIRAQENANVPTAVKDDILRYLRNNVSLEVKNYRLLISQMLAQPFELFPEIDNMSWMTPVRNERNQGMTHADLMALQDELYPK